MNPTQSARRKDRPSLARILAVGAVALPLAACNTDKLLDVTDPALLPPSSVSDPNAVNSLYLGALRDFYIAYSGNSDTNNEGYVPISGVLSDELYNGDTFTTRIAADQRALQPVTLGNVSDGAYLRLQRARTAARRAAYAVRTVTPSDNISLATLKAVEGYTYVTLGEGWCGNVPFSSIPDSAAVDPNLITYTRGFTTVEIMDSAVARFTAARTANPADRLSAVGLARALMNRNKPGDYAAAAAAVATIPDAYVFLIQHSANAPSEYNPIWVLQSNGRYGVSNVEGNGNRPDSSATSPGQGIAYRDLADPRVPYIKKPGNGRAFSTSRIQWYDMNNPSYPSGIPLASGAEARLIEAEVALQAGDVATWLAKLNLLRSKAATLIPALHPGQVQNFSFALAPLTDPGTATARIQLMFQERALWMFDSGHRLGDMRREVRQWGLTEAQVFPTGAFYRGGAYGHDKAYSVPFNEQNNTSYVPSSCDTTQP